MFKIVIESQGFNEVVAEVDVETIEYVDKIIEKMKGCEGYNYSVIDLDDGLTIRAGILSWQFSDIGVAQRLKTVSGMV